MPAPELVRSVLEDSTPRVNADNPGAASAARSVLATRGSCDLVAPKESRTRVADALIELMVEPIESDFLQVYPVAVATTVEGDWLSVRLEVRHR